MAYRFGHLANERERHECGEDQARQSRPRTRVVRLAAGAGERSGTHEVDGHWGPKDAPTHVGRWLSFSLRIGLRHIDNAIEYFDN